MYSRHVLAGIPEILRLMEEVQTDWLFLWSALLLLSSHAFRFSSYAACLLLAVLLLTREHYLPVLTAGVSSASDESF